jgi:hypothetical protein
MGWFDRWLDRWLDPLVIVTILVFLAYVFIFIAMLRQLGEMRTTANAATESTDISRRSERPHFVVEIKSLVWRDDPTTPGRSIAFDVTNYGKSPGRLIQFLIHAKVRRPNEPLEEDRGQPGYREKEADLLGYIVVPTQKTNIWTSGPMLRLDDDEIALYKHGGWLYVYGFIDYTNLQDTPYRSCFGFRYDPPNNRFIYLANRSYWCYR